MRITDYQAKRIKEIVLEKLGLEARVWLFGSRVDDSAKGGDVDLMVSVPYDVESVAETTGKVIVPVVRLFEGRKTDIVLDAPNLKSMPIHEIARTQGIEL